MAIRVELSNGAVGWGEAPILPFVTAEDQTTAMAKASEACAFLRRCPALTLGSMLGEIAAILPGHQFASVSQNNLCSTFSSASLVVNHSNPLSIGFITFCAFKMVSLNLFQANSLNFE